MSWRESKNKERGRRALERQLVYQEKKAEQIADSEHLVRATFLRSQLIRRKLESIRPVSETDRILEVGSGAHGLVFGFGSRHAVGIDPLAVEYKRLFPKLQRDAVTVAAIGERLPFDDASFDIILSDNVIDHAEQPLKIVDEIIRVLRPDGMLYFTVNVHHPFYTAASHAHGLWNAAGIKLELSPFADHTVHLTEGRIRNVFSRLPLNIISQASSVAETKRHQRRSGAMNPDAMLKRLFFKNALFEVVALKISH